jgi:hypothetical protein
MPLGRSRARPLPLLLVPRLYAVNTHTNDPNSSVPVDNRYILTPGNLGPRWLSYVAL